MTFEVTGIKPGEAGKVWRLVDHVARKELKFPAQAMDHYRKTFSNKEIARRSRARRHVLLAARSCGDLAGVLIGLAPEGGVGTVLWVVVDRKHRGQGIGRRLMNEACKRYRGLGCHKIKLTAPNKRVVRCYEGMGMKKEGHHKDHWWHGDFWSMGKVL